LTSQPQLLHPAAPPEPPATRRPRGGWWLLALAVAVAVSLTLTWPLALHPDQRWLVRLPGPRPGLFGAPPTGTFSANDGLQTMHVNRVVIDDVLHLREPYLDLVSGAAGPEPLRTTSLDVPWTAVMAPLLPLGLVPAYNATLVLASVLTVLCAFGLLRRHTRWPLLALAGALAYAFVPGRMFQLSLHFNAVMWWAFPAAAWALEAALERHRSGRRWRAPALWLVAVTATVGLSGEYHHSLYLSGMLGFLVAWRLAEAALRRAPLPLGPGVLALAAVAVTDAYVLGSFRSVFGDSVAGTNGRYDEVVRYAPRGLLAIVHKDLGELGEGLVYLGWPLTLLSLAGGIAVLARRRSAQAPYAVLAVPVLFLTFGPTADLALQRALERVGLPHGVAPYRFLFDTVPFLELQRVTARMLVLAALLLVLLAVVALDGAAAWAARRWRPDGRRPRFGRPLRALAALALVLATAWLVNDYRMLRTVLRPAETGNRVTVALLKGGDGAGPFLGLPVHGPTVPWNAASTYLASQAGRRTLNAYNQSPMGWLEARAAALEPLNEGRVDDAALAVLRETGTRQVVVVNEPHVFPCCQAWRQVVDGLVASGRFRLVVDDPPFALLELVDSP
jgi:hypothetical protein